MHNNESVQSCITSITFPEKLEDYEEGLLKSEEVYGEKQNDIESLLNFNPNRGDSWTAPKWLTSGDIMFFYLTKSFKLRASKLLHEAPSEINSYLKRANELANIYSGTIFACADILDSSFYDVPIYPHFKSKVFAPLSTVNIFKNPIPLMDFSNFIKLRQGAITPLFGESFDRLVMIIGAKNSLPDILYSKKAEKGFYGVNKSNWIDISCNEFKRFLNEQQLREFFINYFIECLKDEGSKVLSECDCYRNGSITGTVDYFIKMNKEWLPIEAKLNLRAEKDLFKQINKYINIDYFINDTKKNVSNREAICLVVDQSGLYITYDGSFIECDYRHPYIKRCEINQDNLIKIKNDLSSIILDYQ